MKSRKVGKRSTIFGVLITVALLAIFVLILIAQFPGKESFSVGTVVSKTIGSLETDDGSWPQYIVEVVDDEDVGYRFDVPKVLYDRIRVGDRVRSLGPPGALVVVDEET